MAQDWNDVYQEYLHTDRNKVAELGRQTYFKMFEKVKNYTGDEEKASAFCLSVFASFAVMDGHLDGAEWALFCYIIGKEIPVDDVHQLFKSVEDGKIISVIDDIIDSDDSMKKLVITLGLCVCAIDGNVDPKEDGLLSYYLD